MCLQQVCGLSLLADVSDCNRVWLDAFGVYGLCKSMSKCVWPTADARFQNTGLERAERVATDIDDLAAEYSLQKPEPAADGPGNNYAK